MIDFNVKILQRYVINESSLSYVSRKWFSKNNISFYLASLPNLLKHMKHSVEWEKGCMKKNLFLQTTVDKFIILNFVLLIISTSVHSNRKPKEHFLIWTVTKPINAPQFEFISAIYPRNEKSNPASSYHQHLSSPWDGDSAQDVLAFRDKKFAFYTD